MMRMSSGIRYEGIIHEHFTSEETRPVTHLLKTTILHHDGYLFTDQDAQARTSGVVLFSETAAKSKTGYIDPRK